MGLTAPSQSLVKGDPFKFHLRIVTGEPGVPQCGCVLLSSLLQQGTDNELAVSPMEGSSLGDCTGCSGVEKGGGEGTFGEDLNRKRKLGRAGGMREGSLGRRDGRGWWEGSKRPITVGTTPHPGWRMAKRPKYCFICNSDHGRPERESMVLYQSADCKCQSHFDSWPRFSGSPNTGAIVLPGPPLFLFPISLPRDQHQPISQAPFHTSSGGRHSATCSAGLTLRHKGIRASRQSWDTSSRLES